MARRSQRLVLATPSNFGNTTFRQVHVELYGHSDILHDLAFSADGQTLASGSDDGTVRLWDVLSGKLLTTFAGHHGSTASRGLASWRPAATSADGNRTVHVWSAATGQEQAVLRGLPRPAMSLSYSRDGTKLAIGSYDDPTIRLWQPAPTRTWTLAWLPLGSATLALSGDGRWLAHAGPDQTTPVLDSKTGKRVALLQRSPTTAWIPDGRWSAWFRAALCW